MFLNILWRKPTWRESHFLVILPLIYSVTRRGALPGTITRGESLFWYGTIATLALRPSGFINDADISEDVFDASHTHASRCQSGKVPCIQPPRTQDYEEMVLAHE